MTRYDDSIDLLEALYRMPHVSAEIAGLARAQRLLAEVGNPHRTFRSVHVAGSSGKGSTTCMIASILQHADFRTGRFQSPHLHEYTERVSVDGIDISRTEWTRCFDAVWPVVEEMRNGRLQGYVLGRPSLFEVLFAMGCVHFSRQGVEWAAVETGMGGRLDATNVLTSDVAVVTNIGLEHTQVLGSTIEEIAAEKAAIIKAESHAVTAAEGAALQVIRSRASRMDAPLIEVPSDVRVQITRSSLFDQTVVLQGANESVRAHLAVAGSFQATNAATAYGAAVALGHRGVRIPADAIVHGLEEARMPGRLEIVSRKPLVLVDGAQNTAGIKQLVQALQSSDVPRRRFLVYAAMRDKNIYEAAELLGPLMRVVIVTSVPGTNRSAPPEEIASAFRCSCSQVFVEPDVDRALDRAVKEMGAEDMIVIAGSLYLVGDVRRRFSRVGVV